MSAVTPPARRARQRPRGIWCVEGEWSDHPADDRSVRRLLGVLEDWVGTPVVHHRVPTRDALTRSLSRWALKRSASYEVLYLAAHVSAGTIDIGSDVFMLDDLAEVFGGRAQGRVLYFGACGTVRVPGSEIAAFRRATGALAVLGYERSVDWVESAAFDLLQLAAVAQRRRWSTIERDVARDHALFAERLGFRIHHGR